MIVCVTPNPALDRTLAVDRMLPGEVVRAERVDETAGGKGFNVARVAAALGATVRTIAPRGGAVGERIAALAAGEAFQAQWVPIRGANRMATIVREAGGCSTVINEPGPELSDQDWAMLTSAVAAAAAGASIVTISGSMPGGVVEPLAGLLTSAGGSTWVDSSGAALALALETPGVSIKVNRDEAAGVLGGGRPPMAVLAPALLGGSRADAVIVTDGAAGACYADADGSFACAAPRVRVVNATGSGDAFLAGIVVALERGDDRVAAMRLAVAAAAVAATNPTPTVDAAAVARLEREIRDG